MLALLLARSQQILQISLQIYDDNQLARGGFACWKNRGSQKSRDTVSFIIWAEGTLVHLFTRMNEANLLHEQVFHELFSKNRPQNTAHYF
jgi:hypothetical protein